MRILALPEPVHPTANHQDRTANQVSAALLTAAALIALLIALAHINPQPAIGSRVHPCPTEDSTGCYWDATTRGNRQGHTR